MFVRGILLLDDRYGGGHVDKVGDGEVNFPVPQESGWFSVDLDGRSGVLVVYDLHVAPADTARVTGAQGFKERLLCGPARGQTLRWIVVLQGKLLLPLGVDAIKEPLAQLFIRLSDSRNLDDVYSNPKYHPQQYGIREESQAALRSFCVCKKEH